MSSPANPPTPELPDSDTDREEESLGGRLALIASPIGNLGDLSFRARDRLAASEVILCEDTRHSVRLLKRYEIPHKTLISLNDHNESRKIDQVLDRLRSGASVALLSDAGMPTISDPGFRLVRACREEGLPVDVLPGPSAVLTALAGSGLPTDAFHYGGFLPPKSGRRGKELVEALNRTVTSIYFESPHRIERSLAVLAEEAPDRLICVARELTKKFETFHRGPSSEVFAEFQAKPKKGEMTLLISGLPRKKAKN